MNNEINLKKVVRNLIIFGILVFGFNLLVKSMKAKTTEELFNTSWIECDFGQKKLKSTFPVNLAREKTDKGNIEVYGYESRHLTILLRAITLDQPVEVSIKDFSELSFKNLSTALELSDVNFNASEKSNSKYNRIDGTFLKDNNKYEFGNLSLIKENTFYDIIIYYQAGDQFGSKILNKAIEGIVVKNALQSSRQPHSL